MELNKMTHIHEIQKHLETYVNKVSKYPQSRDSSSWVRTACLTSSTFAVWAAIFPMRLMLLYEHKKEMAEYGGVCDIFCLLSLLKISFVS